MPANSSQTGVKIFIDPKTGKVVEPTAAQIGAASPAAGGNAAPKAPIVFRHGPGATVGIVLDPASFQYSVATRTVDGKLAVECVTGSEAAEQRVKSGTKNEDKK
jgi:hypothetical protein